MLQIFQKFINENSLFDNGLLATRKQTSFQNLEIPVLLNYKRFGVGVIAWLLVSYIIYKDIDFMMGMLKSFHPIIPTPFL